MLRETGAMAVVKRHNVYCVGCGQCSPTLPQAVIICRDVIVDVVEE